MAKRKHNKEKKPIESYDHKDKKRANNPPVGLVTPETDPDRGKKKMYEYDPHLDPQLVWAGKAEHTSFEVPTVSPDVHERNDPRTIIAATRRGDGNGGRRNCCSPSDQTRTRRCARPVSSPASLVLTGPEFAA